MPLLCEVQPQCVLPCPHLLLAPGSLQSTLSLTGLGGKRVKKCSYIIITSLSPSYWFSGGDSVSESGSVVSYSSDDLKAFQDAVDINEDMKDTMYFV